jgi:hypothetical protein
MAATEPQYFLFQFNAGSNTDNQLKETTTGQIVNWLWSSRMNIREGDWVVFSRIGELPAEHTGLWRGLVGFGQVAGPVMTASGRASDHVIPVRTALHTLDAPYPKEHFLHHPTVAPHKFLFTGARGTNFRLEEAAGKTLIYLQTVQRPDGRTGLNIGNIPDGLDEARDSGDSVWQSIGSQQAIFQVDAAIALHAMRRVAGFQSNGRADSSHLLAGVLISAFRFGFDKPRSLALELLRNFAVGFDPIGIEGFIREAQVDPEAIDKFPWNSVNPVRETSPELEAILQSASKLAEEGTQYHLQPVVGLDSLTAAILRFDGSELSLKSLTGLSNHELIEGIGGVAASRLKGRQRDVFLRQLGYKGSVRTETSADKPSEQKEEPAPATEVPETDPAPVRYNITPIPHAQSDDPNEVEVDHLDVGAEARAFARLIGSRGFKPPLAIGVFGKWGSGKTFFMNRIMKELEKLPAPVPEPGPQQNGQGFCTNIVQIRFNAWHYMETNVWASLVDVIFKQLDAWLRQDEKDDDHSTDKLFDNLSTAQELKLDAIEALAERLKDAESARKKLTAAKKELAEKGPGAKAWWEAITEAVIKEQKDNLDSVSKELGLDKIGDDTTKLKSSISELRKTAAEGNLLWRSIRNRAGSPLALTLLAVSFILIAVLGLWLPTAELGPISEITTAIGSALGVLSVWGASLAAFSKSVVGKMREFDTAVRKAEESRLDDERENLASSEARVVEAETQVEVAEKAAADAQQALWEGSAVGRISAFIRKRAEGDDYSRHLGVIATIRRDFEQLTALMSQEKDDEGVRKAWEEQRKYLQSQVTALRKRYSKDRTIGDADPVIEALKRMEDDLEEGTKPGRRIDRIVLFIDDLDRCPPQKVYEVLQAVHLFLAFRLFVIVVGVDTRWMETSLQTVLRRLVSKQNGATPRDYLEKIFQIPYWTRSMDGDASQRFVSGLLQSIKTSEVEGDSDDKSDSETENVVDPKTWDDGDEFDENAEEEDFANESTDENEDPEVHEEEVTVLENSGPSSFQSKSVRPHIYSAVSLTEDEKAFMRKVAIYAGDTPRQALRFVNVYGLVKSVLEEPETRERLRLQDQKIDHEALIGQLAIATGTRKLGPNYFSVASSSEDLFTSFLNDLYNDLSSPDADHVRDCTIILNVMAEITGDDSVVRSYFSKNRKPGDHLQLTELYKRIHATAPIARRYTFAS